MSVKIDVLELREFKKIKWLRMMLTPDGLILFGGGNGAGKTSILDGICWTLGGDRYKPSQPDNQETGGKAWTHIRLSNGLDIERTGKNGTLKVTNPNGMKGSQTILNDFISQFALDLPKFMNAGTTEKASILLGIIGVGDQLTELERQEREHYDIRTLVKKELSRLEANFKELQFHPNLPERVESFTEMQRELEVVQGYNRRRSDAQKENNRLLIELQQKNDLIEKTKGEIQSIEFQLKNISEEWSGSSEKDEISFALEVQRKAKQEMVERARA